MTHLLREEMGFNGVIVTDALNMKAIADHFGQEEAVVMAVKAGVDIALMPAQVTSLQTENRFAQVLAALKKAVQKGEIPVQQINKSAERIISLKIKRGIYPAKETSLNKKVNHLKAEKQIAERSVTVLQNKNRTLPFKPKKNSRVLIAAPYEDQTASMEQTIRQLIKKKEIRPVTISKMNFAERTFNDEYKKLVSDADYVITGSYVVKNDPVVNDGTIDDSVTDPGKWTTAFPRAVMKSAQSNHKPLC